MNSTKTALWHDFHQTGAEVRCLYNSWRTSHVTKTWALLLYEPLVCHDSSVALVCPLIMMNLWNFSWGNTWTTDIINQFSRAPNSKLRVLKPERGIQRREVAGKHGKIPSPSCVTGRQSLQARTLDAAGHTLNFCKGSCHSSWQRAFNMVGWGQGVCEGIQGVWRNVTEFDDVFLVAEIWSFIMNWYVIFNHDPFLYAFVGSFLYFSFSAPTPKTRTRTAQNDGLKFGHQTEQMAGSCFSSRTPIRAGPF